MVIIKAVTIITFIDPVSLPLCQLYCIKAIMAKKLTAIKHKTVQVILKIGEFIFI